MSLQADVVRVMLIRDGKFVAQRIYGRDADPDGIRVDTVGFAARTILDELKRAGSRGRARSGLEKTLRSVGFSDPGRMFAFACDRFLRDGTAVRSLGNRHGTLTFYYPEVQS